MLIEDKFRRLLLSFCLCSGLSVALCAYASEPSPKPLMPPSDAPADGLPDAPEQQVPVTEKGLPLAILKDQRAIWSSPVRIRTHDLIWRFPLGAATGVTLPTDTYDARTTRDPGFNKDSVNASNALLGGRLPYRSRCTESESSKATPAPVRQAFSAAKRWRIA